MKRHEKTFLFYASIIAFVLGWWGLAFREPALNDQQNWPEKTTPSVLKSRFLGHELSILSIDRDLLKSALAGDFNQMSEFISEWDVDAELLQSLGVQEIQRLTSKDLLRSKVLMRHLKKSEPGNETASKNLADASTDAFKKRFLPQTFTAASFLLAILPSPQIVALPKHLREQELLFPKSITDKIPLDIDRYHAEKLFLAKADVAFIAQYSHPATLQTLKNQGIALYTMKDLTSLEAVVEELMNLGRITNHRDQAELLKIFIDAAMIAIDNKQRLMTEHCTRSDIPFPKMLVLNYHNTFSVPSKRTLNGKILDRLKKFTVTLKASDKDLNSSDWVVPIDKEHITLLNPSCLVIIRNQEHDLRSELQKDLALRCLPAVQENRLFFVDEAIHHSPTQYIVLAYHDLVELLEKIL